MFSLSWDFCNTQEQLKLSRNYFVVGRGAKQGVLWEVLKWQIAE